MTGSYHQISTLLTLPNDHGFCGDIPNVYIVNIGMIRQEEDDHETSFNPPFHLSSPSKRVVDMLIQWSLNDEIYILISSK